jgi:hypothetical protein
VPDPAAAQFTIALGARTAQIGLAAAGGRSPWGLYVIPVSSFPQETQTATSFESSNDLLGIWAGDRT